MIEGYFGGALARELETQGDAAVAAFAIDQLAAQLGSDIRARLTPLAVSAWGRDPFARGSYSYARPGQADARAALAAPVDDRLFFAGEAVSARDFSTAHGGIPHRRRGGRLRRYGRSDVRVGKGAGSRAVPT